MPSFEERERRKALLNAHRATEQARIRESLPIPT
jgi:hypothetical protein